MAKMTRMQLKSIVKECLIEIMTEGLGQSDGMSLTESLPRQRPSVPAPVARVLPKITANKNRDLVPNSKFDKRVSNAVTTLTGDPIMREILENTARTTMQEQNDADAGVGGGNGGDVPLDALDAGTGASDRWASLAFASPVIRSR